MEIVFSGVLKVFFIKFYIWLSRLLILKSWKYFDMNFELARGRKFSVEQ